MIENAFHRRARRLRFRLRGMGVLRLSIFRSNRMISAQVIDDSLSRTLAFAIPNSDSACVGKNLADSVHGAGIDVSRIAVDRGGYRYHGRVRMLVESYLERIREIMSGAPAKKVVDGGVNE